MDARGLLLPMNPKTMPDLAKLYCFAAVARYRSFRGAALHLAIGQSVLSRKIQDLESHYGCVLLQRGSRGVSLTEAGAVLLEHVDPLLEDAARLDTVMLGSRPQPAGRVKLALPPSFAELLVPLLAAKLAETNPSIALHIAEGAPLNVLEQVTSGDADIAIVASPAPTSVLIEEELGSEEVFLIGALGKGRSGYVTVKELAETPLIGHSQPHGMKSIGDKILKQMDADIKPSIVVDGPNSIRSLVLSGRYSCILPPTMFMREIASGQLEARRFSFRPSRTLAVASAREKSISLAARTVARVLRECAQKVFADYPELGGPIGPTLAQGHGRRRERRPTPK